MENQPVGLVFIMKKEKEELDLEKELQPFFPQIIKNLSDEGYVKTKEEFDRIFDAQTVHFIRLDSSDFKKLEEDEQLIGATALDAYVTINEVQPHEDVNALHYNGDKAPWGFDLYVAVVYSV
ncbi:MAG: hypothetical protein GF364_17685 [Candidatus Lokiarchaeota archaeon]|nr:hypothetical protein [Candidatus Lokiarchaeota archaeon]